MANVLVKSLRWSYARIKKRDIFSQSISLTYKGSETRRSIIGGWVSVGIILLLLTYSVYLFDRMIYRKEISWNQNTKRYDWTDPNSSMVWDDTFPQINVTWTFERYNYVNNETYQFYYDSANVEIHNLTRYKNGSIEANFMDNSECDWTVSMLANPNNKYITIWPNLTGFELRNREEDTPSKMLVYSMSFWPSTGWTPSQIQQIKDHPLTVIYVDSTHVEVDLDNIEDPIREYPNNRANMYFRSGYDSYFSIEIRRNEVYLEDSWFPMFGEVEPIVFYTATNFYKQDRPNIRGEGTSLAYIEVTADNEIYQYKRKVLSLLEVTGTIGGIFELLEVTVGIFIGFYSSYMFKRDIKKNLSYAEDKYREVQKSIHKLNQAHKEILDRLNAEEEKKNIANKNIVNKQMDSHNERNNINEMRRRMREIQLNHQNFFDPILDLGKNETESDKKDPFDKFKDSLDWIDIVYSIKTLRLQVDYLLSKDPEYQTNTKVKKIPITKQNNQPIHKLRNPFQILKPVIQRNRSFQRVNPEVANEKLAQPPQKLKQSNYQRVKRYLDEEE